MRSAIAVICMVADGVSWRRRLPRVAISNASFQLLVSIKSVRELHYGRAREPFLHGFVRQEPRGRILNSACDQQPVSYLLRPISAGSPQTVRVPLLQELVCLAPAD